MGRKGSSGAAGNLIRSFDTIAQGWHTGQYSEANRHNKSPLPEHAGEGAFFSYSFYLH